MKKTILMSVAVVGLLMGMSESQARTLVCPADKTFTVGQVCAGGEISANGYHWGVIADDLKNLPGMCQIATKTVRLRIDKEAKANPEYCVYKYQTAAGKVLGGDKKTYTVTLSIHAANKPQPYYSMDDQIDKSIYLEDALTQNTYVAVVTKVGEGARGASIQIVGIKDSEKENAKVNVGDVVYLHPDKTPKGIGPGIFIGFDKIAPKKMQNPLSGEENHVTLAAKIIN